MSIRKLDVGQYISSIQNQIMEEFGCLDLPKEVKVRVRNFASQASVSVMQALAIMIENSGSLENLVRECRGDAKRLKRASKRVRASNGTSSSLFSEKAITPGQPPLQGGAVGLGKRSKS